MGAVKRDREKEREGEKADMYCGCLMTGKEEKKKEHSREAGEMVRERCSDRMRKPCERRSVRECCEGERDSVTSKKPVAADTERGTDPVAPPLWVNNHHKPWLCLMNPLPMS